MRQHWIRRAVAAPLAIWFVLMALQRDGEHACPIHEHMAMADHGAMAGMSGSAPGTATAAANQPEQKTPGDSDTDCTCKCDCCGPVPPVRILDFSSIVRISIRFDDLAPLPDAPIAPVSVATQVVLPPSVGPPTLLA